MKKALLYAFCFLTYSGAAQAILFSAAINYTNGAPTTSPGASGSRLRVDANTGRMYQWNGTAWVLMAQGVDIVAGCAAPAYAPGIGQSKFAVNGCAEPKMYYNTGGTTWVCLNCVSGAVSTDASLTGDGSVGDPLGIAQQGATEGEFLVWSGTAWEPSFGTKYVFVTATGNVSSAFNTVLVGTAAADVTIGLPTCNAANDGATFEIKKNGSDSFQLIIDPSGSETFSDGAATKTIYSPLGANCVCRFSSGVGVWFFTIM